MKLWLSLLLLLLLVFHPGTLLWLWFPRKCIYRTNDAAHVQNETEYESKENASSIPFVDELECLRDDGLDLPHNENRTTPILTMFVIPMETTSVMKTLLQYNALKNWKLLEPDVELIVFTESEEWKAIATSMKLKVSPIPETSPSGTPIITSCFQNVSQMSLDAPFIGYANADLLLNSDLVETLKVVRTGIAENAMGQKTLVIGTRTNYHFSKIIHLVKSQYLGDFTSGSLGTKYDSGPQDAEDYFIFYRSGMFDWNQIPKFAVGRNGYDNWLVLHAYDEGYDVVDGSRTITCIHQTDDAGNYAGSKKTIDKDYNYELMSKEMFDRLKQGAIGKCANWSTWHWRGLSLWRTGVKKKKT